MTTLKHALLIDSVDAMYNEIRSECEYVLEQVKELPLTASDSIAVLRLRINWILDRCENELRNINTN